MCYSALVWQSLSNYLRETGAVPDFEQIERMFAQRLVDKAIRIPRGFERNFDNPQSIAEKRIKDLIDQHRAVLIPTFEQEIFKQNKRLADAERELKMKETKTAQNDVRIGSAKIEMYLEKLSLLKGTQQHADDNRIFPMTYAPIVVKQGEKGVVRLARYHLRQNGKPPSIDRQFPSLYNARRDNLEKFWRKEFGHDHALMIVDSFFENVQRDGKNVVLHFMPRPASQMHIACLYAEQSELLSFAAITDEPPAEVAAAGHDRCIVNMRSENVDRWLTPEGRGTEELQGILSDKQQPYYGHEIEQAA
jgi:putative SOS response-associated peptidase YedK